MLPANVLGLEQPFMIHDIRAAEPKVYITSSGLKGAIEGNI